ELISTTIMFFEAAVDTTSNVIRWLLFNIAINQEIQDRIRKEVIEATSKDGYTYDTVASMKYIEACMKETMRWGATDPYLLRKCKRDTKIGDLSIKKGTQI